MSTTAVVVIHTVLVTVRHPALLNLKEGIAIMLPQVITSFILTVYSVSAWPSLLPALQVYFPRSSCPSLEILRLEEVRPSLPGPLYMDRFSSLSDF